MSQLVTNDFTESNFVQNERLNDISNRLNKHLYADNVKTVIPTDHYAINCFDNISTTLFGVSSANSNQIVNVDTITKIQKNYGNVLPISSIRNVKILSPTSILVEGHSGDLVYKLYKTSDSGVTWDLVLTQNFADVRMLSNRSVCIANIKGVRTLFYGEYNVNGSRVAGSTNDRVRLLKSVDDGSTWTTVTEWNTNGTTRNIRHIHAVKQNPFNGRVYVITGDSNEEAAIFSYDGFSVWPSNLNPSQSSSVVGLSVAFGRQAFRTVDLLFKDELIYMMPDAPSGGFGNDTECGIWSISTDLNLSTLRQISTVSTHMTGIAGWYADWLPDGRQVWLGGNENVTSGEKYNCLILSNLDLTNFKTVGAFRSTDVSTYITPINMFVLQGEIFTCCGTGSGKTELNTVSCVVSDNDFRGDFYTLYTPDTIHPVYWVDAINGSDTNNGYTPRTPFKTAEYALSSGRVTYGGRLQVIGSELPVLSTIQPVLNGNTYSGDPTEFACIQGDGATKTTMFLDSTSAASTTISFTSATAQLLELRDIRMNTKKTAVNGVDSNTATSSGSHQFRVVRCILGDYLSDVKFNRLLRSSNCPMKLYSTIVYPAKSVSEGMLDTRATGLSDYYMELSYFSMGNYHTRTKGPLNKWVAYKTVFSGAYIASMQVESGATFSLISGVYCPFYTSGVKASKAINDLAGLSWSGQFKSCNGNQQKGVQSAFDGYSINEQGTTPLLVLSQYVY